MTSNDTLNRFDDFLDERGRTTEDGRRKANDVDPTLAEAARRFHAMDASDREPEPHPDFLMRLQEDLMNQALTMPAGSTEHRAPSIQHPRSAFRLPSSAFRPRRAWPNLAAAAVILLTLAAGFLAYRLAPNGADDPPTLPAAAQGTPVPNDATVDIAECATERRPDGTAAGFASEEGREWMLPQYNAPGPDRELNEENLPFWDAPEVDASTFEAMSETVRQLTACRVYATSLGRQPQMAAPDLDGQYFALFSDHWFRKELNDRGALYAYWVPAGPYARVVEEAHQIGRERAVAVFASVPEQAPQDRTVAIFSKQGDRWLIDELLPVGSTTGEEQVIDVVAWDDGAFIPIYSPDTLFSKPISANEHLIISLANIGTKPHRLMIKELGIDVLAQPGHSEVFVIVPATGTYQISTAVIDEDGQSLLTQTAELTVGWEGDGTPPAPHG